MNLADIAPHMNYLARYRLDQRKLRELHRAGLTKDDAEECNRILTTDYASQLAAGLDVAARVARELHLDLEACRADVRGLRSQLDTQRRAIEAYQADRMREGRFSTDQKEV